MQRRKPDGSVVTNADIEAQALIVEGLHREFPGIPIVGEESKKPKNRPSTCWFVDPIDGTAAFVEGMSTWGPTIGLVVDDVPVMGALLLPRTGDFWCAKAGKGAWQDGERIRVRDVQSVTARDVLYAPSHFHRYAPRSWPGKIRSLGSIATHLALVASGAGVLAAVSRWNPWDVACGILLIEEAGGVITDWHNRALAPLHRTDPVGWAGTTPFLAGAPRAVERLVQDAQEA